MWMKIDDGLHAHRKTRAVTKSHQSKLRDSAPMGLWVLARRPHLGHYVDLRRAVNA